ALKTIDVGYLHTSNGQEGSTSRSLDRYFLRGNFFTKVFDRNIGLSLMAFAITNVDATNEDIVNHYGYWDLTIYLADLWKMKKARSLHLETRFYAGPKLVNVD